MAPPAGDAGAVVVHGRFLLSAAVLFAVAFFAASVPARAQLTAVGTSGGGTPPPRSEQPSRVGKPFRIGIAAAARGDAAADRVEPFRARVASRLDLDTTVTAFPDERGLARALAEGRIDYAPLSGLGFAVASRLCGGCVEPLAAPRSATGGAGWRAVVVVRTGSAIGRLDDLAGRRVAVSAGEAIGTRRLPLAAFAAAGLTGARAPITVEVAGPAAALSQLIDGRVEAAALWTGIEGRPEDGGRGPLHDAIVAGRLDPTTITVVWRSPDLPNGPQTVRADLDEGRKRLLRDLLVELDEDPDAYAAIEPVASGGFVRVGRAAYAPFVDLLTPKDDTPPASTGAPKG